jgi:hypothetical protein
MLLSKTEKYLQLLHTHNMANKRTRAARKKRLAALSSSGDDKPESLTEADTMMESEEKQRVEDYIDTQPDINVRMRSVLAAWLVEVQQDFDPDQGGIAYLAMMYVDRYLAKASVSRKYLQLIGCVAYMIASKVINDNSLVCPDDMACISDGQYSRHEVISMEKHILEELQWNTVLVTPFDHLRLILAQYQGEKRAALEFMSEYFATLASLDYKLSLLTPSTVAAASFQLALFLYTGGENEWNIYYNKKFPKLHLVSTPLLALHTKFQDEQVSGVHGCFEKRKMYQTWLSCDSMKKFQDRLNSE